MPCRPCLIGLILLIAAASFLAYQELGSERLLALTDGVVAVVITIMVLELKPPHGAGLADLVALWPTFLSFALSFVYVAIYWNNHHHFFRLVPRVDGAVMWANLNLLFWLSLIPFTTAWMDEHQRAAAPVALYGASLLAAALSWALMQAAIVRLQGSGSPLRGRGRPVARPGPPDRGRPPRTHSELRVAAVLIAVLGRYLTDPRRPCAELRPMRFRTFAGWREPRRGCTSPAPLRWPTFASVAR